VEPRGFEPLTSAVQRRRDRLLGLSGGCKSAVNLPILRVTLFLSFQVIYSGCCTVAAPNDVVLNFRKNWILGIRMAPVLPCLFDCLVGAFSEGRVAPVQHARAAVAQLSCLRIISYLLHDTGRVSYRAGATLADRARGLPGGRRMVNWSRNWPIWGMHTVRLGK
jgi:hypothetical protein